MTSSTSSRIAEGSGSLIDLEVAKSKVLFFETTTYTNGSLTATTKTLPASLSLDDAMYPGTWLAVQVGPNHDGATISQK